MRVIVVLIVILELSCVRGNFPLFAAPLAEQEAAAVARYAWEDGHCTAWHAGDGYWITAGHCCQHGGDATIGAFRARATYAAYAETGEDACVVVTADEPAGTLTLAPLPNSLGTPLHYIGYPHGVLSGHAGLYWGGPDKDGDYLITAAAAGGASGSPVMRADGRVVGVLVAGYATGDLTFFRPSREIEALLRRAVAAEAIRK